MDKIGTSHIANVDYLICLVTVLLIVSLDRLPRSSIWSRVLALLCGCLVISIIPFLILADLGEGGVFELSWIALALCFSLGRWNDRRSKPNVANDCFADNCGRSV
jgi:hypothetical protein